MFILPFIILLLIATSVGVLQMGKARRSEGLKRTLALGVAGFNFGTALTLALVLVFQGYDWPGPGLVIVASILASVALWTASLIWAGPPEKEDRQVFMVTVGLMAILVLSAFVVGMAD